MTLRGKFFLILCAIAIGWACRLSAPDIKLPDWQYEIARKPEQWLREEPVRLLRDYVRVDTTNPPGNERRGAEFLKDYLDCEGVPSQILCAEDDRCSLYSRLPGKDHDRAVMLLSHIDVVPAYAPYWQHPTFEGQIERSYLYGRGAYDMKATAIIQLLAFTELFHSGIPLSRDVILFAEYGEELPGNDGVEWVFRNRPELFSGVNLVLNEGGYEELTAGQLRYWGLEVGQSGYATAMLTADDPKALQVAAPFQGFGLYVAPSPPVKRYLDAVSEFRSADYAGVFRRPERLRDPEVAKYIPYQNLSLLTGGVYRLPPFQANLLAAYDFGQKWDAPLTISVPLGMDPRPYLEAELAKARAQGAVARQVFCSPPGVVSPYPTPDTEILWRSVNAVFPGTPFVPMVSSFLRTTSAEFRERGIPAYGFSPFMVDTFDAARRHGNDERIFLPFFTRGLPVLKEALYELTGDRR